MASIPLQSGTLLNQRYLVMEALGQGGMGTVYKAEHIRLHAIVAVKEIRGLGGDESQHRQELDRCEHEASFLVRLNHANLPKVSDAFIENDCFYLIMDYIEGLTLETRLTEAGGKPLDVLLSVELGLQIADVLAYLHSQDPPIIFRDLKPSNVMVLPDGTIKLIDFGIARHFQPGALKDTSLLGSVGYSPPEQFGKGQTDPRSDVYAFGATLHHLLTGRDPALQPFKFPLARTFNTQIPESLSHLLDMCVALDPNQRPESANVVAVQLLAIREELLAQRARGQALQAPYEAGFPGYASLAGKLSNANPIHALSASRNEGPADKRSPGVQGGGKEVAATIRVATASQARPRQEYADPAGSRNALALIVMLLLSVIGGGVAVALYSTRPHSSEHGKPAIITAPLEIEQAAPPDTTSDSTAPKPSDDGGKQAGLPPANKSTDTTQPLPSTVGTGVPANATNDAITLQTALLAINNDLLPIAISGSIKGMGNTPLKLAIYFFDAKGQPLDLIDPNEVAYTNEQKFLCTYKTLTVASDDYAVRETLSIPVRLLAGSVHPRPFVYQAMLFQEGRHLPIYKTSSIDLPADTYGGVSSSTHTSATGDNSSSTSNSSNPSNPSGTSNFGKVASPGAALSGSSSGRSLIIGGGK